MLKIKTASEPTASVPDTAADDPRMGHFLSAEPDGAPLYVLLGFPSDAGVALNGGRVGAALAPDAIRQAFYRLTPHPQAFDSFRDVLRQTHDLGNLVLSGDVASDQELLAEVTAPYLQSDTVVMILGGGHETAFGHYLGYTGSDLQPAILNWDAHADVRPLKNNHPHSGSPFRQALLHPTAPCPHYTVVGLLPHSTAKSHLDFIQQQNGRFIWGADLTRGRIDAVYDELTLPTMVTFDLDAVDQAYAPGVSAPATGGMDPSLWFHAAYRAGRSPLVRSMDLVEMNPLYDRDGQTARLAALTLWHFFLGLAECRQAKHYKTL